MRIDLEAARDILRAEANSGEPAPTEWVELVDRLTAACESAPKTHIAMLGTALLAKSADARVDVYALKVSAGTEGAYSARLVAKEVLAALAPELGIDLGVTGREPLNNQPYFRPTRISEDLENIIRGDGLPPFRIVLEALDRLKDANEDEARSALRAFLRRRRKTAPPPLDPGIQVHLLPSALEDHIRRFVSEESESGKRAQAVAAALLDAVFGRANVEVDKIHDPDRHLPGDVGVREAAAPRSVLRVYEVRDKPVLEHDIFHFLEKVHAAGVRRAGVVCVGANQTRFDLGRALDEAFERGIALRVYFSWYDLVTDVLFEGKASPRAIVEALGLAVYERLMELEVSLGGLSTWASLVREASSTQDPQAH